MEPKSSLSNAGCGLTKTVPLEAGNRDAINLVLGPFPGSRSGQIRYVPRTFSERVLSHHFYERLRLRERSKWKGTPLQLYRRLVTAFYGALV